MVGLAVSAMYVQVQGLDDRVRLGVWAQPDLLLQDNMALGCNKPFQCSNKV